MSKVHKVKYSKVNNNTYVTYIVINYLYTVVKSLLHNSTSYYNYENKP